MKDMLSWGAYVLLAPEVRDQFVVVFKFQYLVCIVSINFTITMQCQYSRRGNMRVIQVFAFLDYCHLFSQLLLRVSASLWQLTMLFCSKTIE